MDATPRPAADLTLLVVSDHSQAVRRYRLPRRSLHRAVGTAAALLGTVVLVAAIGVYRYRAAMVAAAHGRALADENAQLRAQMRGVQERVAQIQSTLERVQRFDAKLRSDVAELRGAGRKLALSPSGSAAAASTPAGDAAATRPAGPAGGPAVPAGGPAGRAGGPVGPAGGPADPTAATGDLPATLDTLAGVAALQEQSLSALQGYFERQRSLLASSPSTWPARGWVTSDFGARMDPITAERVMHQGLDIAAPHGHPVTSPSDGTVVFAGVEPGYGKVITVDHGYGVKTRYGHLSEIAVKSGERVRRGARLGAVGNTGRSTGPHLHYEVRVNGIPENPRKFILE
jgi:murein DD-endopeptidase MepM/ murein hydrolase activator NlpD